MSVDLRLSCMIKTWSLRDAYIHDIVCLNICFYLKLAYWVLWWRRPGSGLLKGERWKRARWMELSMQSLKWTELDRESTKQSPQCLWQLDVSFRTFLLRIAMQSFMVCIFFKCLCMFWHVAGHNRQYLGCCGWGGCRTICNWRQSPANPYCCHSVSGRHFACMRPCIRIANCMTL